MTTGKTLQEKLKQEQDQALEQMREQNANSNKPLSFVREKKPDGTSK